jgi:Rrf2 family protein
MVRFSVRETYSVLAILALSLHWEQSGPLQVSVIAHQRKLSPRFLEQVMILLKKQGLVESVRGARGGYRLSKSPDKIALGEVLRAVEGAPMGALPHQHAANEIEGAVIQETWKKIETTFCGLLDAIHFQDLCTRVKEGERKRAVMFHI